jgi:hypothetical protein
MFRRSLRRPHAYHFSKPSAYCKVVIVVELQSLECIICGIFTELFTIVKTTLAPCYGLMFFFNTKPLVSSTVISCIIS